MKTAKKTASLKLVKDSVEEQQQEPFASIDSVEALVKLGEKIQARIKELIAKDEKALQEKKEIATRLNALTHHEEEAKPDYHHDPLASYRSIPEFMHKVMVHLYKQTGAPVSFNELWGEMLKGSSRGGRAATFKEATVRNNLGMFASGKFQAKGKILWNRVAHGYYVPII